MGKAYPAEELPVEFGVMDAALLSRIPGRTSGRLIACYYLIGEAAHLSFAKFVKMVRFSGSTMQISVFGVIW